MFGCCRPRRSTESCCSWTSLMQTWFLASEVAEKAADTVATLWTRNPFAALAVTAVVGTAEWVNTSSFQLPKWGVTREEIEREERSHALLVAADEVMPEENRVKNPCAYYSFTTLAWSFMLFNSSVEIIFMYEALNQWGDLLFNGPPMASIDPASQFLPDIEGYEWGMVLLYLLLVRWPFDAATIGADISKNMARIFPPGTKQTLPKWMHSALACIGNSSIARLWFIQGGAFAHTAEHLLNMLLLIQPLWLRELDFEDPLVIGLAAFAGLLSLWGGLVSLLQTCLFEGKEAEDEWLEVADIEVEPTRPWLSAHAACCFKNNLRIWGPIVHGADIAADVAFVLVMFTQDPRIAYAAAAFFGLGAANGFRMTELNSALLGIDDITIDSARYVPLEGGAHAPGDSGGSAATPASHRNSTLGAVLPSDRTIGEIPVSPGWVSTLPGAGGKRPVLPVSDAMRGTAEVDPLLPPSDDAEGANPAGSSYGAV